jgi:prevent-host-death family protein
MTVRTIGTFEARRIFGKLIDTVRFGNAGVIVEKNGEEAVAIVPVALFRQWQQRREAFFARLAQAAQQANMNEDDAKQLANDVVREVREESRKNTV